jgi:23S rRNA (uracil1939-C5)-methyltransferase
VRERGWAPWDIRNHHGFLRHLVLRTGTHTGEAMVILVTNGYDEERMADFGGYLQEAFPEVTTFVNMDHQGRAQNAQGEEHVVFGPGVIHDTIGGFRFAISPPSFFQTNTRGAEALYRVTREFAELRPDDLVYDLYCGAGTISIYLAGHVRRVVGLEVVPEAVADAEHNAGLNGVENCAFVAGDTAKLFTPDFVEEHGTPDVLVVDPPRAGLHPDVVKQIGALAPERFVYVSCNPRTQVRDLEMLREVYRLEAVQPVDLFPHTPHIENVARLRRRG